MSKRRLQNDDSDPSKSKKSKVVFTDAAANAGRQSALSDDWLDFDGRAAKRRSQTASSSLKNTLIYV